MFRLFPLFSVAFLMLGASSFLPAQSVNITEFLVGTTAGTPPGISAQIAYPLDIVTGPDGALWYTVASDHEHGGVARITTSGAASGYAISTPTEPGYIAAGPAGALWFTDLWAGNIGRITTSGSITEYSLPASGSGPVDITAGPDGALWFTEESANQIGRITTSGAVTEYAVPTALSGPFGITAGPDGALWFTEEFANKIGRIATSGAVVEYPIPTYASSPLGIVTGPDGALWFTERNANKIGRITTSGAMSEYSIPTASSSPAMITSGPDGALWFTEAGAHKIGRIATSGATTDYPIPTPALAPGGITTGPDGALWFTEYDEELSKLGRVAILQPDTFFTGQQEFGTGFYLQFQDGNPFGYYSFLQGSAATTSAWLSHSDLGYEYVTAGDANGDLYFWDLTSNHWWYTSASLFPYLYDFALNSWIYYFPNTTNPGHYTTNPRSFSNLTSGIIFTM